MATAHKAEIENKEAQDKVQARSAVTTEPVEGATELGNQMARLMAALTRAKQGNNPGSAPNRPMHRGCGRGRTDRKAPSHPNSNNGQTGLGQTASTCSISVGLGTGTTGQSHGNVQGSKDNQGSTPNRKDTSSLQCFRCQGRGHMAQECATPAKTLNQSGGTEGMWPNQPLATTTTANSRLPALPLWPQTKTDYTQSSAEERMTRGHPCPIPLSWPHHLSGGML